MTTAMALIFVLTLLSLVVGLVLLPFKRVRRRGKWMAAVSAPVMVASFVTFVVLNEQDLTAAAQKQGFADQDDRRRAEAAGIKDSGIWKERQRLAREEELKANHEREERQRLAREQELKANQAREEQKRKALEAKEALLKPPYEQVRFIQAIEKARSTYKAGQTDLQRGAARPTRARDICAAVRSSGLRQWIGKISSLSTNGDGDGVFAVRIADGVTLTTMNNSMSDIPFNTLIKSSSSLYKKLLGLKVGEVVRFDGQLYSSDTDCYRELSLTLGGSIDKPDFIVNFSRVDRVDPPAD